jgi:N4-gp56 family major capsid protein
MANTIIIPTIFSKEVIRNRDIKNVFYKHTNSDYTGELRKSGDTVTVQTLPTLSFTSGTAGAAISATDFTITSENLVIDQVEQLLVKITDEEKVQSNLELTTKVAERFAEAEARLFDEAVRDQILVTQVADIPAANKLDSGSPITLTPALAYTSILNLSTALDEQNVAEDGRVAFVSPNFANNLMQSNFLDSTDAGLNTRFKGFVGMVNGVKIVKTNALTASKEVIMLQEGAVNMVVQLNNYDVRKGTDGFYENLMAEVIYGLKIFGENAKAIAIQYVA